VKTLAHEIGHALLHDPELVSTRELTREVKELEAESVAYITCRALGLETGEYSFGYVVGWAGGGEEALKGIKASTSRIQRAAASMLKNIEESEPVVEAVNVVSADVSREQWREVDAVDVGARWRVLGSELARLYDMEVRVQKSDASSRSVRPTFGDGFNGADVAVHSSPEFGF
jgi:hypothetical protein